MITPVPSIAPRTSAAAPTAEDALADAIRRASRQPHGRIVLVLHLSRMAPPAPRAHHRRIARALLQDAADLHEGQVFVLRNGDLVLLCRGTARGPGQLPAPGSAPEPATGTGDDPAPATESAALPQTLARLLRADAPDPAQLVSVWTFERDFAALCAYAGDRRGESVAAAPPETTTDTATRAVATIGALVAKGGVTDLIRRQTAVAIHTPRHPASPSDPAGPSSRQAAMQTLGQAMRPLYREIGFSIATLEARCRARGQATHDPFLFRHLARGLDRRLLEVLRQAVGGGGPLDVGADDAGEHGAARPRPMGLPLHLNLTLPAILSEPFFAFAAICRERHAALGVEVSLMEACADSAGFAAARRLLRAARMTLVLDGVSHLSLLLSRPAALGADLLKLEWSPLLPELAADDAQAVQSALHEFGVARVALTHVDSEAALRWGLAQGIRKFQGRHIEAILGASRMTTCPLAPGCTPRQCIDRAAATWPEGRVGCGNTALLDSGHDPDAPPRPAAPAAAPPYPPGGAASPWRP